MSYADKTMGIHDADKGRVSLETLDWTGVAFIIRLDQVTAKKNKTISNQLN